MIYLPLELLTRVAGPVLAAPWEVELITVRGSPEVRVKLKAPFCHTGIQTQVQRLVCKREIIMPWYGKWEDGSEFILVVKGENRKKAGKKEDKGKRIVLKTLWMDRCMGQ